MQKHYEAPEVLELGAAAELTLGAIGCKTDGCECEKWGGDSIIVDG